MRGFHDVKSDSFIGWQWECWIEEVDFCFKITLSIRIIFWSDSGDIAAEPAFSTRAFGFILWFSYPAPTLLWQLIKLRKNGSWEDFPVKKPFYHEMRSQCHQLFLYFFLPWLDRKLFFRIRARGRIRILPIFIGTSYAVETSVVSSNAAKVANLIADNRSILTASPRCGIEKLSYDLDFRSFLI